MSVPAVSPGRSIAHRLAGRGVVSPLGFRFLRDIGSPVGPPPPPAVVMTRGGAKSGRARTSALVYFTDRGRVILIASNFGESRNPAWYHNVKANPTVTLYGRGIRGHFVAEEIHGAERDRLFQRAKDAPAPYGQHEQVAAAKSRYIPVIGFTPQNRER